MPFVLLLLPSWGIENQCQENVRHVVKLETRAVNENSFGFRLFFTFHSRCETYFKQVARKIVLVSFIVNKKQQIYGSIPKVMHLIAAEIIFISRKCLLERPTNLRYPNQNGVRWANLTRSLWLHERIDFAYCLFSKFVYFNNKNIYPLTFTWHNALSPHAACTFINNNCITTIFMSYGCWN